MSQNLQFHEGFPTVTGGVTKIRKDVGAYVKMAGRGQCVVVFVDLDTASCAPILLRKWFSEKLPEPLIFRVAVHEIESWVMADHSNLARFLKIPIANFPQQPDELPDPKQSLLKIIRQKGRKGWHQEMLPQGRTASIGPRYNEKICAFIEKNWNPVQAARNSESLAKAIAAFQRN